MSRAKANEEVKFEDFKASMKGIFTTSVTKATIDEVPMAYIISLKRKYLIIFLKLLILLK